MSRLFACMCNEPERLRCALHPAREALVAGDAPDGWGLAFFQGGEVLLQRHPKPVEGSFDFYPIVRDLRTDYLIGHVRTPGAKSKLENTQPFRFRTWVFAHSGTVSQFGAIQSGVLEHIPDFLRRNIRGESDSEHVFHLFLAFLHDEGKLDDPTIGVSDVANAVRATVAMLNSLVVSAGGEVSALNLVVTNGRVLVAVRRGKPMWMRRVAGMQDCAICREAHMATEPSSERMRFAHDVLRFVLIVSEPTKIGPEGWEEVPEATVVGVSRDLTTTVQPLSL